MSKIVPSKTVYYRNNIMIIVTGGAGFIGSGLIAALNKRGIDNIIVVDELGSDQKFKNLIGLRFADYIDKDDFLELVIDSDVYTDVETVFHMGACSSTTETDADYLIRNNYEYTKLLAEWCIEHDIRFIYASSAATYGDGSKGFTDDDEKLNDLVPLNMYGYSKHLFDQWARRHDLLDKIVGLKYFNVFGPNEYHKADMRSFILKSFEQIRDTGKVKLFKSGDPDYADGEYMRDFVYVKDAVDMTLFFMDNPKVAGLYNIGTGRARTWNDMVKAVFAAMAKKPQIEFIEMPENLKKQYQYFTQADIAKLKTAGCKTETTTLEAAVRDYVSNYLIKRSLFG